MRALFWPTTLVFASLAGCGSGVIEIPKDDTASIDTCPQISMNARGLAFDDTRIAWPASSALTVQNRCEGSTVLQISATPAPHGADPSFTIGEEGELWQIAPGDSLEIPVVFTARDYEEAKGNWVLQTNDPVQPEIYISLIGQADPDQDGDGFDAPEVDGQDCNDFNPGIYPGAPETYYDGIDANCDGQSDFDQDLDGVERQPEGLDCNDLDETIHPGQEELLNQSDDNCDGFADEPWYEVGDVLISEIMMDPLSVFDTDGEWIELYNTTDRDLNLLNWQVQGESSEVFTIEQELILPVGGITVLGTSDESSTNGGAPVDFAYDWSTFRLNNDADRLSLLAKDTQMFALEYDGLWPVVAGTSMALDSTQLQISALTNPALWCSGDQLMTGGDRGTPGAGNGLCATVDHDGDGYAVADGDCDDTDPMLHPEQVDWMNGLDDNCDGRIDHTTIEELQVGYVQGPAVDSLLGAPGSLTAGDLNGNGITDLAVGMPYHNARAGGAYVLDASRYSTYADVISSVDSAEIEGPRAYGMLGTMGDALADNTGDGKTDLVVGGADSYYYSDTVHAALFAGGFGLTGTLDIDDATMRWTGGAGMDGSTLSSSADLTGDGVAELVLGYARNGYSYSGAVGIFLTSDLSSGDYDLGDADQTLSGEDWYQYLGSSIFESDADQDGYDDVLLCGVGYHWSGSTGTYADSSCWLVMGSAALGDDDSVEDAAEVSWSVPLVSTAGFGRSAVFGDVDDDGKTDLAISAPGVNEVYVYLNVASLSGELDASDADATLTGTATPSYFGEEMRMADINHDGIDDLVVAAPDMSISFLYSTADEAGEVYTFEGGSGWTGSLTEADAGWTVLGADVGDGFGSTMLFHDLDGDGDDEWTIAAPGDSLKKGAVYFAEMK
jgi:hypothetical protein